MGAPRAASGLPGAGGKRSAAQARIGGVPLAAGGGVPARSGRTNPVPPFDLVREPGAGGEVPFESPVGDRASIAYGRHRQHSPSRTGPPSASGFAYRRYTNPPRAGDIWIPPMNQHPCPAGRTGVALR